SNVRPGMRAFDEEVFGPVINITVFDTDDEAAELANHGEYGLAAGILSASVSNTVMLITGPKTSSSNARMPGRTL
ncbi:aldehyde dehydrogenase family protein, partial [Xanthomonas arboricola]|uniref:aldehyde dehydrogenase family protein n=1 Tax=Xanthomonas arboricola TaxID=56448 RepID=UPI000D43CC48